jgi:hypothetical protein
MIARRVLLFALAAGLAVPATRAQTAPVDEQQRFSYSDRSVRHPVPIPPAVMAILDQDVLARSARDDHGNLLPGPPAASWFLASQLHIGKPGETDLIVISTGPLAGENVVMFWLFRMAGDQPKLILRTGGHDLAFLPSQSHGLADIETHFATDQQSSDCLFRFDGKTYRLAHKQTTRIR